MTRADVLKLIPAGDLYACDDEEELTETDPDGAVAAWVDKLRGPGDTLAQAIARVPMPVTVKVYERKVVSPAIIEDVSDEALDALCNAFDLNLREGADDMSPWPDAALTEAKDALLEVARKLFAHGKIWDCEEVGSVALDAEQVAALLGDG